MIRIWNDKKAVKKDTYLRLTSISDDVIALAACDESGQVFSGGFLLYIYDDGAFIRPAGVSENLGLDVVNGQINIK